MSLAVPRHAPLPRLSFGDWLRRELSPVLALIADASHALRTPPLPPLVVTVSAESHGTIPVTRGAPWETVTTELEALP
jgi:hypothetical protein